MLRHRLPDAYLWIIVWFVLAIFLLWAANALTPAPLLIA
jgi:hypothetical protein